MLSTAQALRRWEAVVDLLARIKAHTVACPAQPAPTNLQQQLEDALDAIQTGFITPASTWTQLLQQKVRGTSHTVADGVVEWSPLNQDPVAGDGSRVSLRTASAAASAAQQRLPAGGPVAPLYIVVAHPSGCTCSVLE